MNQFKVFRAADEFLKDKNLSLRAKGFLAMILFNNNKDITNSVDLLNYCADSEEVIRETLLELRINHYIKYNDETNILEADAVPYDKREEELDI